MILGLGNELYGDEGVGIHVIRKSKKEWASENEEIAFEESSLSGISLLEVIVGYDRLVIVDTMKKSKPTSGRIHLFDEHQLRHIPGLPPHYVSIPQTIAIGRKLGLKFPSQIKIVAAGAKNIYNLGEGLSPAMKKALPHIVSQAKEILKPRIKG